MKTHKDQLRILATTSLVVLTLSSCLKDKPFPLYGNKPSDTVNYSYALTADTLQEKTYTAYISTNGNYFVADNAGSTAYNYWPQAHTLDVLTDGFLRTKNQLYVQRMKSLLNGTNATNGGSFINDYYDDMQWLALASLRAYSATSDHDYLAAATTLWTNIQTGLNTSEGGGIAWRKEQLDYKNTPANAPAVILACRLYELQKNEADLATAKNIYTWLKATLVDPTSGIIWDGINGNHDGLISKVELTYNQGVFMGAGLELFHATGNTDYLNDAVRNARATIVDGNIAPGGIMRSEGQGDGGLFKGILVRYMTLLIQEPAVSIADRAALVSFLKFNAQTLFTKGMSRPQFSISPDWNVKPAGTTDLTTQLSGMMMIEAAATLKASGTF